MGRFEGEGGIVALVFSGEAEPVALEGGFDEGEGGAFFAGGLLDDKAGFGRLGGGEDGDAGADGGGFLGGDLGEGGAEPFGVVEGDGGDEGEVGGDGGGGVEAPAHAGFEGEEAAAFVKEVAEGEGEGEFEEGGVGVPVLDEEAEFVEEAGRFFPWGSCGR